MRYRTAVWLVLGVLALGVPARAELSIPYEKFKLENGLTVILHEDKSDPIVAVAIQYHVGSNREVPGRTGFAHLFEHIMFQESQHVGQDQFFKKIQGAGGTLNGGTSRDGTVYFQVVPKNSLEMVLWLESDRMGFLLSKLTQEAFANQQGVVQNEKRQNYDNRPYGQAGYVLSKLLFPGEPSVQLADNWSAGGLVESHAGRRARVLQEMVRAEQRHPGCGRRLRQGAGEKVGRKVLRRDPLVQPGQRHGADSGEARRPASGPITRMSWRARPISPWSIPPSSSFHRTATRSICWRNFWATAKNPPCTRLSWRKRSWRRRHPCTRQARN